ncbi:MAG: DUF418 domain-containing protein [Sphingosinicella sp.]|uniref:DUF418 domain-containing protein n=1 Tax=Sphingosinicella sp. TaxID=1917971 RepID=UPI0040376FA1
MPAAGDEKTVVMTAPPAAAPAAQRIEALDFVRGVALFGILLMNITGFGLPDAYTNPQNSGGAEGVNLLAWIVTQVGFEGTQRALFSMLFGASVILLTSRLEASGRADAADIYFRRNLWLIGFGLLNAFVLLWYGDILYAYGVTALFVFAFRKLAVRWLLTIGIAVLLLGAAWNAWDTWVLLDKHEAFAAAAAARDAGATLSEEQQGAITAWEGARTAFKATPEGMRAATEAMRGGYVSAFAYVREMSLWWQTWGLYRYFSDIFGMMLIGMALFHAGVLTLRRRTGLYVAMMAGGYAVGLTVNFLETRWIIDHQFSALAFAQANLSYDLGRLAMTIGHLGALLLFVRSNMLGLFRRAMAAVGQMAVTNYLTHSVVCAILFVGLGWFNTLERHQLYYVVFAIWAAQIVISPLWLRHFRFGPVEWLWRYLTYLKRPPFRRT